MPSNKKLLQAAAGNAGESLYVEDVFSTYLYTGNGSTQTITNGIDLSGEGGLVWRKQREAVSGGFSHNVLVDTERGASNAIFSDLTDPQYSLNAITSFNSNGFSVTDNSGAGLNLSGKTYASWSFRKAEKFFDVVTYTGNSTAGRTVSHNLGSVPAVIIVKKTSSASSSNWYVYHSSLGSSAHILLNTTSAADTSSSGWNSTNPTATEFTLGNNANVNASGESFVAYLFASDAGGFGDDGDENIIKCGSFTNNSASVGVEVNCGFEPQWLLIKGATTGTGLGNWVLIDSMRGASVDSQQRLYANASTAEGSSNWFKFTSQGFTPNTYFDGDLIYIAIRRPMKTPESGTEVFKPNDVDNGASSPDSISGFPVDMYFRRYVNTTNDTYLLTRLTSPNALKTNGTDAEAAFSSSSAGFDYQNGVMNIFSSDNSDFHTWMFKRATGFFDVVAYTGTGAVRTIPHNLGVAPEMMLFKIRNQVSNWQVYASGMGPTKSNRLNNNGAPVTATAFFNDTAPTSSVFTVGTSGNVNWSGNTVIAYLFATLAGVSKVGSYTGTAANLDVDCGFSAGARFILIKRTDSSGDWHVWDSSRGISASTDPYLLLNTTAAEVTNTDYIDPLSSGFTVTSSAPAALNASGGTYIFLAIS
jgi:hypothetical protein